MTTADPAIDQPQGAEEKPSRGFPTPATILLTVAILVWIATFLIPSGTYRQDDSGSPIPGTWESSDLGLSFLDRLKILLESPVNGL